MKRNYKKILISRTDGIGDVILTLPMIGILNQFYPKSKIYFLGTNYTKPIIECVSSVDEFINWSELSKKSDAELIDFFKEEAFDVVIHVFPNKRFAEIAKRARIKIRIGTSHRLYHVFTCNKFVSFTRKNSNLHEAQLNIKLLSPLKIKKDYDLDELIPYLNFFPPSLDSQKTNISYYDETRPIESFIDTSKINLVLHPKSNGSACEWSEDKFGQLIDLLPADKYHILLSGNKAEGEMLREFSESYGDRITDVTGIFSLEQFIYFLSLTDGIVAPSTGPLHIMAALGKFTLGLYSPIRPIFPTRWAPLGEKAYAYTINPKECKHVKSSKDCSCIDKIQADSIAEIINNYFEKE
jgi:ADP-heptose:LPS heptosyltransferase